MRTALVLVGLGILAMMELEASPRTKKPGNQPLAPTTVGLAISRDTLTAADRFEIAHVQHEATVQLISPVEPSMKRRLTDFPRRADAAGSSRRHRTRTVENH